MSKPATARNIVFLLYEGIQLLDLTGPAEVFATADKLAGGGLYNIIYVARATQVTSSAGLPLLALPLARAPRTIHTLIVPGAEQGAVAKVLEDAGTMSWLTQAAARAGRIASICTGAFLLAPLGLLDGGRAATHWSSAARLANVCPGTTVDAEALFIENGRVWTSAGVAAGIDMALALVARDHGPDLALDVARELVLHLVRPGGQSQFSSPLTMQRRAGGDLARLVPWLEARLHRPVTVEAMAEAMGMTMRSFHRRCVSAFMVPPGKLLTDLRLDRARMLLGDGGLSVADIALKCGFADVTAFSKAFARRYGASPSSYRRAFRTPAR